MFERRPKTARKEAKDGSSIPLSLFQHLPYFLLLNIFSPSSNAVLGLLHQVTHLLGKWCTHRHIFACISIGELSSFNSAEKASRPIFTKLWTCSCWVFPKVLDRSIGYPLPASQIPLFGVHIPELQVCLTPSLPEFNHRNLSTFRTSSNGHLSNKARASGQRCGLLRFWSEF